MDADAIACINVPCSYLVRTSDYREQFSDLKKAQKAFDKVKRDRIKDEQEFSLVLSVKEKGSNSWTVIDQVKIGKDYYA